MPPLNKPSPTLKYTPPIHQHRAGVVPASHGPRRNEKRIRSQQKHSQRIELCSSPGLDVGSENTLSWCSQGLSPVWPSPDANCTPGIAPLPAHFGEGADGRARSGLLRSQPSCNFPHHGSGHEPTLYKVALWHALAASSPTAHPMGSCPGAGE